MKVKTLIITAILALSMVAGTTGCAGSTETASGIATTASTTEESTTQAETVNAGETSFDYDEVCKNIVINGKQYTFPFSVEELGEGYSIGDISYSKLDNEDEYYSVVTDLYYQNKKIASVSYYGLNNKDKDSVDFNVRKIDDLYQNEFFCDNPKNYIEFSGLKLGDDTNKIIEFLGNPTEKKGSTDTYGSFIYSKDEKKNISYTYKNNNINGIVLSFNNNY